MEEQEQEQVYCWACTARIVVPQQHGHPAAIFKVPRPRHAYTDPHSAKPAAPGAAATSSAHDSACWRCLNATEATLEQCAFCECCGTQVGEVVGVIIVAIIVALIGTLAATGVYPILWDYCESLPVFLAHAAVCAALLGSILLNYAQAVCLRSRVARFHSSINAQEPPQQGALDDFTFCTKCNEVKPPNAHHCSVCCMCIVDMDHHCPFINNCVGRANMRPFLLFLFWVVVAMAYAATVTAATLWKHRRSIEQALRHARFRHALRSYAFVQAPFLMAQAAVQLPLVPFVAMIHLLVSVSIMLGVGVLCVRHWWYAASGTTYVGAMRGEHIASGGAMDNLRYVFGARNPLRWLLPSLQPNSPQQKGPKSA